MPLHPDLPDLQKVFDFTDEDLRLNRTGLISTHQQKFLEFRANDNLWLLGLLGCLVFGCNLYILIDDKSLNLFFLAQSLFVFALLSSGLIYLRYHSLKRVVLYKLAIIEGNAVLYHEYRHAKRTPVREPSCYLEIYDSKVKFRVTVQRYRALRDGYPYCVYYLSNLHHIFSIEPLFELSQPVVSNPPIPR